MQPIKHGCSSHAVRHLMAFGSRRYLDALARAVAMCHAFDVPSYVLIAKRGDGLGTVKRWQIIVTDNPASPEAWGPDVSLCGVVTRENAGAMACRVAVLRTRRKSHQR